MCILGKCRVVVLIDNYYGINKEVNEMEKIRDINDKEMALLIDAIVDEMYLDKDAYAEDETRFHLINSHIMVVEDYQTGSPGYCGDVIIVLYDGCPGSIDSYTWDMDHVKLARHPNFREG